MENQTEKIKETVLKKIEEGKIKVKPRIYFIMRGLLIGTGAALILACLVYLLSFVFFMTRRTGMIFLPEMGPQGVQTFFTSFPWLLIGIAILFFVILEFAVSKMEFTYRQPMIYSIMTLMVLVIIAGLSISATPFHRGIMERAENSNLPPIAGEFYRRFNSMDEMGYAGKITEIKESDLIVTDMKGETIDVKVTPDTKIKDLKKLEVGDTVFVFGKNKEGSIEALGIRKIDKDFKDFPQPPNRPNKRNQPISK